MIRIRKSLNVPPSLLIINCTAYDGQDVQSALVEDQDGKCYLCEQSTHKSFQIEHLKSKAPAYFPGLTYNWTNLFLSCPYCNGRKPNDYNLLDPTLNNIEEMIIHRFDLAAKTLFFSGAAGDAQIQFTTMLLTRLFNGKNNIRDIKAKLLYDDFEREIVFFLGLLLDHKTHNSNETKQKVIDNLLITKEFLAFKHWIISDNSALNLEFHQFTVWNK